jgi:hypothetical protein
VPAATALALAAVVSLGAPVKARAQACCAGATAFTPGRLAAHEDALAGVLVRATVLYGAFEANGSFVASPKGTAEVDLEEDLFASVRVLGRGQLTLLAPLVETYRRDLGSTGVVSDLGGGFGDFQAAARWDFTLAGASVRVPGIAALVTLTLPTGVPPEAATDPLASESTGTGAYQGAFGLALEQSWGKLLVNVTGSATVHSARTVEAPGTPDVHTQVGPAFNAFAAVAWTFDAGPVGALTASYTGQLATVTDSGHLETAAPGIRQLRIGASAGYELPGGWRLQGGVFMDPPIPHVGQNEPTGVGLSATAISTW